MGVIAIRQNAYDNASAQAKELFEYVMETMLGDPATYHDGTRVQYVWDHSFTVRQVAYLARPFKSVADGTFPFDEVFNNEGAVRGQTKAFARGWLLRDGVVFDSTPDAPDLLADIYALNSGPAAGAAYDALPPGWTVYPPPEEE